MKQGRISIFLGLTIAIWTFTFVFGVTQNSEIFVKKLYDSIFQWALFAYIFSWTWTNVMVLACTASIIGELGKALMKGENARIDSAIIRGFFIYLMLVGGQLILAGTLSRSIYDSNNETIIIITQGQYFRVSTFISLLAFLVGYNPDFFSFLIKKVQSMSGESTKD